jgi:Flp pilus assembly protein TadD
VAKYPEDSKHWNNLGYLYTQRGRVADALRAYESALRADPGLATAEQNLQGVAAQNGLPRPKILDVLARLRDLEARVMRRDYSDATLALAQRLDRELPDLPKTRFFLGSLLMARGRPAEAVAPLEWVASRQPNLVWGRMNLGEAYLALGRRAEALEQYRAALELEPSNAQAKTRIEQLSAK